MKKLLVLVMALVMSMAFAATSFAAEQGGVIGFVNMRAVLNSYPNIENIAKQIADKQNSLQQDFNKKAESLDDKGKLELQAKLNTELAEFENRKMAPVQKRIHEVIVKVAQANGIASVVSDTAMIAGGKNLTDEVVKELTAQ